MTRPENGRVEIVFLLAGLAFIALGILIVASEVRARRGTEPIQGRVIGFSNSRGNAFHSIAEYTGADGRTYYIEGSVGSSVPLRAVGDTVTVLANPQQPDVAVIQSGLSFILGGVFSLIGCISLLVFWKTFRPNIYSAAMAAIVIGGIARKIQNAWRQQPLSLELWRSYKKQTIGPKVFTKETQNQIAWADPMRIQSALATYKKTNRFAVPVLLTLGAGLLFLSYHLYGKTQVFLTNADPAQGTVIGLKDRESSDNQTTYAAEVAYINQRGEKFRFVDSFSASPPLYHAGQNVNVLYNRNNPNDAQIDRGIWNYAFTALCLVLGVMFLACGLYSARNPRFKQ